MDKSFHRGGMCSISNSLRTPRTPIPTMARKEYERRTPLPFQTSKLLSLVKDERLEELFRALALMRQTTCFLVPLSALLIYAQQRRIPPKLVWFSLQQAAGETQPVEGPSNGPSFFSEFGRFCPTIKASDGGEGALQAIICYLG